MVSFETTQRWVGHGYRFRARCSPRSRSERLYRDGDLAIFHASFKLRASGLKLKLKLKTQLMTAFKIGNYQERSVLGAKHDNWFTRAIINVPQCDRQPVLLAASRPQERDDGPGRAEHQAWNKESAGPRQCIRICGTPSQLNVPIMAPPRKLRCKSLSTKYSSRT